MSTLLLCIYSLSKRIIFYIRTFSFEISILCHERTFHRHFSSLFLIPKMSGYEKRVLLSPLLYNLPSLSFFAYAAFRLHELYPISLRWHLDVFLPRAASLLVKQILNFLQALALRLRYIKAQNHCR